MIVFKKKKYFWKKTAPPPPEFTHQKYHRRRPRRRRRWTWPRTNRSTWRRRWIWSLPRGRRARPRGLTSRWWRASRFGDSEYESRRRSRRTRIFGAAGTRPGPSSSVSSSCAARCRPGYSFFFHHLLSIAYTGLFFQKRRLINLFFRFQASSRRKVLSHGWIFEYDKIMIPTPPETNGR